MENLYPSDTKITLSVQKNSQNYTWPFVEKNETKSIFVDIKSIYPYEEMVKVGFKVWSV